MLEDFITFLITIDYQFYDVTDKNTIVLIMQLHFKEADGVLKKSVFHACECKETSVKAGPKRCEFTAVFTAFLNVKNVFICSLLKKVCILLH